MKIMMPLSLGLSANMPDNLVPFAQNALIDKRLTSLHRSQWASWLKQRKPEQLVRFQTAPLQEFIESLAQKPLSSEILLLHPEATFDNSAYNYLIQSSLYTNGRIQSFGVAAYGHPGEYLTKAIAEFQQEENPSITQLDLFITLLNQATQSYLICKRCKTLEPDQPLWRMWIDNLIHRRSIYYAHAAQWKPYSRKQMFKDLALMVPKSAFLWLDSCQSLKDTQYLKNELLRRKFPEKQLRIHQLLHVSRDFPNSIVFVTVTPDSKQIVQIRQRALTGF